MSRRSAVACSLVLSAVAVAGLSRSPAASAAGWDPAAQERIYVSVADAKGKPVTGLAAADFSIAIDGRPQEVLSATPATEPLSVVILTDRLGMEPTYSSFFLHSVLSGFVKRVRAAAPGSRFALTTFDGPVVRLASFATPPADLDRMLGRLATNESQSAFLNAVADASQVASTAPTDRRVIFTVFAGYRGDSSTLFIDNVGGGLLASKASLWAIEVRSSAGNSFGNTPREQLADRGSTLSGGLLESVGSTSGLDTQAKRMADLISAQYVVTYAPGGGSINSARQVGVKGAGRQVYAPAWIAR